MHKTSPSGAHFGGLFQSSLLDATFDTQACKVTKVMQRIKCNLLHFQVTACNSITLKKNQL